MVKSYLNCVNTVPKHQSTKHNVLGTNWLTTHSLPKVLQTINSIYFLNILLAGYSNIQYSFNEWKN